MNVESVIQVFRQWLYLPDVRPLLAVLGTVAAARLPGDPVWLVLVGPPGGGKTELLQGAAALDDVHPIATLTEASLLSGTSRKEHDYDATGGLLRSIGDKGIMLCKDFTSDRCSTCTATPALPCSRRCARSMTARGLVTSGRVAGGRCTGPARSD